ncbi:MAG: low-specificity L-threonine aldolase [Pirellulales bacterium]|nr:low-specificity L-threonine aldolase [Pirellulales bacterium]
MTLPVIDLRSDTVTLPTPEMRAAMADAAVGDDVFREDPAVNELQEVIADLLGKEAALFTPSGSMANQIALRTHCQQGDEFICESGCHVFNYEQGAFAQLSGLIPRTVDGKYGVLRLDQVQGLIRPDNEHLARTRLVTLENTHNRGGGKILPMESVKEVCGWAHENGLATHLDGARLFNAVVASKTAAKEWSQYFDTVSVCFSKGLGAPVGSALAGTKEMIAAAHRHRKMFGGGMRQAGIIAAGALFALRHQVDRLAEDHELARQIGSAVAEVPGLTLSPPPETNIVLFDLDMHLGTAAEFSARLEERGVLAMAFGPQQIRAVTHLNVSLAEGPRICDAIAACAEDAVSGRPASHVTSTYG